MTNLKSLDKLISSLETFDAREEFKKIVVDNKDKITDLQKEQMAAGVDISGRPRVDGYRPLTIQIKKAIGVGLGAVTDRVTFFMTGKLYQSLRTDVKGDTFETVSERFTFDKMIERVGNENYGLDSESRKEFATEITVPEFRKVLKEKTGLK